MKKKGFTLVEVIISIILVSVVLVSLLATLVKLRETYSVIHENSDVVVYSSSVARVINNDFVMNNGIRFIECNSQGTLCDITLGNDEKRRLEIKTDTKTRNSRTADKENSLKVVVSNKRTSLVYWNTSLSEKTGHEEDKDLIYIKTLEQETSTSYEKDSSGLDTNKVHLTRTDGYAFEYMECDQVKYEDASASGNLVDLMTLITVKVDDGSKAGTNKYDISLYASGRYDESKIIGQRYTIALDYGDDVISTGTTSIDEVYGVAYYVYNPTTASYDRKDVIDVPKRQNYVFLGYFYKKNGSTTEQQVIDSTGRIVASTRTFQSNVVKGNNGRSEVYAKYHNCTSTPGYQIQSDGTCVPKEYTVRLEKNGGSGGTDDYKVLYQAMVPNINIPKKDGHVFKGYSVSGKTYHDKLGKGLEVYDFASDKTFTAEWQRCAAGTYADQTASVCERCDAGTYSVGGVNTCAPCPVGSATDSKGSSSCTPCAKGTYARTTGNKNCTVCVAGSFASATSSTGCTACASGTTTSLPGQTSASACSTCANAANVQTWKSATWATNNTVTNLCQIESCDSGYTLSSNKCNPNPYQVHFNANGGSGTMSNQSFVYGTSQKLSSNNFTRTNYSFQGWATSESGGVAYSNGQTVNNLVTSGTFNLYAVWLGNPYQVRFNANGGSGTMSNQSFTYGTAQALSANSFTKANYTFQGWATSASGGVAYNNRQSVNNLIGTGVYDLYAVWKANSKTITLDNQSASTAGSTSVTVTFDSPIPTITVPGKAGYVFTGYFSATSGGTQYINANGTSARNWDSATLTKLYARWKKCTAGYYCAGDNTEKACPKGRYSSAGASSCTPCAVGSYQDSTGQSVCKACSNGKTTSSTGQTASSACTDCTNKANVSSWKTQTWSPNSVANLCTINACNSGYENSGNVCKDACKAGSSLVAGNYVQDGSSLYRVISVSGNTVKVVASAGGSQVCIQGTEGWYYSSSFINKLNNAIASMKPAKADSITAPSSSDLTAIRNVFGNLNYPYKYWTTEYCTLHMPEYSTDEWGLYHVSTNGTKSCAYLLSFWKPDANTGGYSELRQCAYVRAVLTYTMSTKSYCGAGSSSDPYIVR